MFSFHHIRVCLLSSGGQVMHENGEFIVPWSELAPLYMDVVILDLPFWDCSIASHICGTVILKKKPPRGDINKLII